MARPKNSDNGIKRLPNGKYQVRITDYRGKRPKKTFQTLAAAREYRTKMLDHYQRVTVGLAEPDEDKERKNLTLAHLVERYRPLFERKKASRDEQRFARNWKKELGAKLVREIRPEDIQKRITRRLTTVKPATVNREVAFLRWLFNRAIEDDLLDKNPLIRVKQLKENNTVSCRLACLDRS